MIIVICTHILYFYIAEFSCTYLNNRTKWPTCHIIAFDILRYHTIACFEEISSIVNR